MLAGFDLGQVRGGHADFGRHLDLRSANVEPGLAKAPANMLAQFLCIGFANYHARRSAFMTPEAPRDNRIDPISVPDHAAPRKTVATAWLNDPVLSAFANGRSSAGCIRCSAASCAV